MWVQLIGEDDGWHARLRADGVLLTLGRSSAFHPGAFVALAASTGSASPTLSLLTAEGVLLALPPKGPTESLAEGVRLVAAHRDALAFVQEDVSLTVLRGDAPKPARRRLPYPPRAIGVARLPEAVAVLSVGSEASHVLLLHPAYVQERLLLAAPLTFGVLLPAATPLIALRRLAPPWHLVHLWRSARGPWFGPAWQPLPPLLLEPGLPTAVGVTRFGTVRLLAGRGQLFEWRGAWRFRSFPPAAEGDPVLLLGQGAVLAPATLLPYFR